MDENRTLNIASLLDQIIFLMLFLGYTVIAYGIGWILNKVIKTPPLINKHFFRWVRIIYNPGFIIIKQSP